MLADHHYSAAPRVTHRWRSPEYQIFANSDRQTKKLKQQLDEHLIGVAHHAERIVKKLPKFKRSLAPLGENQFLGEPVNKKLRDQFGWQDKAVKAVTQIANKTRTEGFFGINMASTGKGKTIANAKIMYALGEQTGGTRFCVAMGLRTLTLQTAQEFRDSLQLSDEQLAVMIGGTAVRQLFENAEVEREAEAAKEAGGSESDQKILHNELLVHYSGATAVHSLSEWTASDERLQRLLCAPVLVCTIDHLMPATEGVRGGRQIGPMLRLLGGDLILDEPDDFGLEDLPALCRLVHWAGMLGSRVLLSTATMPPVLANALFQAYRAGWCHYARDNISGWTGELRCAWFDEHLRPDIAVISDADAYKKHHKQFVTARLKGLEKQAEIKRDAKIVTIEPNSDSAVSAIVKTLHAQLYPLHQLHCISKGNHRVSIGLIRMANINPLVAVAQEMLKMPAPENTCIHYCVYHSRYPLAIRSHIESRLDKVLKRKDPQALWAHDEITSCLQRSPDIENHLFVVLASPVAEVGRDHDYDWAMVEPSSVRSIIQLAGRVLRHRELESALTGSNILLLNQNYRALNGRSVCFKRPGFESDQLRLESHELLRILPTAQNQTIDATPRIQWPENCEGKGELGSNQTFSRLNDLEHRALQRRLLSDGSGADVWWKHKPHWCGEVQRQQPFRKSQKDEAYYLFVEDEHASPKWKWLNENVHPAKLGNPTEIKFVAAPAIELGNNSDFWFEQDALAVYSKLAEQFGFELEKVSRRFGELRITNYRKNEHTEYHYSDSLGAFQELDK